VERTPLPLDCRTPTLAAVSSLWTPGGEYKVPRPGDATPGSAGEPGDGPPGEPRRTPSPAAPGPEQDGEYAGGEPTEAELRELARQLAEAPPEDVIANHCYGLFELAALHLSQRPANLVQARLAIDAMGLLVEGLGDRLGSHAATLADGLTQLRLAYVRITDSPASADQPG
jgi:hypothetical protein